MGKNILEEFISRNEQFIILILGLPCSNKSSIAKGLSVDMKLKSINVNKYIKKKSFIKEKIDGLSVKMYEHPDNYNWEKLNNDVNKQKNKGIILYGNYIDTKKIDFDIDFIFFINMNNLLCKKILLDKKLLPYDKDNEDDDKKINSYFKNYLNPLYDELKKNIKINKYYNMKEDTSMEETYENLWDTLMNFIMLNLKSSNKN